MVTMAYLLFCLCNLCVWVFLRACRCWFNHGCGNWRARFSNGINFPFLLLLLRGSVTITVDDIISFIALRVDSFQSTVNSCGHVIGKLQFVGTVHAAPFVTQSLGTVRSEEILDSIQVLLQDLPRMHLVSSNFSCCEKNLKVFEGQRQFNLF